MQFCQIRGLKRPEEVPLLVESMVSKVMEEFERRIASQNELVKTALKGLANENKSFAKLKVPLDHVPLHCNRKDDVVENKFAKSKNEKNRSLNSKDEDASKEKLRRQHLILNKQEMDIQELKHVLRTTRAGMDFMQIKYCEFSVDCHVLRRIHAIKPLNLVLTAMF